MKLIILQNTLNVKLSFRIAVHTIIAIVISYTIFATLFSMY